MNTQPTGLRVADHAWPRSYHQVMDLLAVVLGTACGLVVGALAVGLVVRRTATSTVAAPLPDRADEERRRSADLAGSVLETLRIGIVVLDPSDEVLLANAGARRLGVLQGGRVVSEQLRELVRTARREDEPRERDLVPPVTRLGRKATALHATAAPLARPNTGLVALLVEDTSEARRVESTRRDFVANVSHELKTPIASLSLLSEAIGLASTSPEEVQRFSSRMRHEAERLARLVQELMQLSRYQGADPLPDSRLVDIDGVVAEALDRTRLTASTRDIELVSGGNHGLKVLGDEFSLGTALVNLLENAIAYSPERTRVAVGVRLREDAVEISVSDQGIGIAEDELERVFERFYRADPARSRATGGTGLGLAIVKHIATNHGGSVGVWSVEGSGSTFTLRLPVVDRYTADDIPAPEAPL